MHHVQNNIRKYTCICAHSTTHMCSCCRPRVLIYVTSHIVACSVKHSLCMYTKFNGWGISAWCIIGYSPKYHAADRSGSSSIQAAARDLNSGVSSNQKSLRHVRDATTIMCFKVCFSTMPDQQSLRNDLTTDHYKHHSPHRNFLL